MTPCCPNGLVRGVGQPSESSSSGGGSGGSSEEGQEAEVSSDGAEMEAAQAQWGVGALAANPAERIPDGGHAHAHAQHLGI